MLCVANTVANFITNRMNFITTFFFIPTSQPTHKSRLKNSSCVQCMGIPLIPYERKEELVNSS